MDYPDELTRKIAEQQRQFTNKCIGAQAAAQGALIGGGMNQLNKPVDHTWILTEGLKRLVGGQQVLDAYHAASGANKAQSSLGGSTAPNLDAYYRSGQGATYKG